MNSTVVTKQLLNAICFEEALELITFGIIHNQQPQLKPIESSLSSTSAALECPSPLLISKIISIFILIIGPLLKLQLIASLLPHPQRHDQQVASQLQFHLFTMEIVTHIIGLSFNIRNHVPLTAYGEVYFLLIQNVLIVTLALISMEKHHLVPPILFLIVFVFNVLLNPSFTSLETIQTILVMLGMPLTVASMVPAIIVNYKNKHCVGFPLSMLFIGQMMGLGRVWTTVVEVSDRIPIVLSSLVGPCLNLILIAQAYMYLENTKSASSITSSKKD